MRQGLCWTVLILCIALVGCGDSDITRPADPDLSDSSLFGVATAEDAFASIQNATLEQGMSMELSLDGAGRVMRTSLGSHGTGSQLGPILSRLELDRTQIAAIVGLILEQQTAFREAYGNLLAVNRSWIEQANEERRAIVAAYRAGEISRDEAEGQLVALSQRTREAIRNNPDNGPYLAKICLSRKQLFEGIREILTEAQRPTWDAWADGALAGCETI